MSSDLSWRCTVGFTVSAATPLRFVSHYFQSLSLAICLGDNLNTLILLFFHDISFVSLWLQGDAQPI